MTIRPSSTGWCSLLSSTEEMHDNAFSNTAVRTTSAYGITAATVDNGASET